MIVETIQGASGFIEASQDFLNQLKKKCIEFNVLIIFDEIQTCFGRTGKLFGFQHTEIVPDILCIAKQHINILALGNWHRGETKHAHYALKKILLNVPCRKYKGMFVNDLTSHGPFWNFRGIMVHFKSNIRLLCLNTEHYRCPFRHQM